MAIPAVRQAASSAIASSPGTAAFGLNPLAGSRLFMLLASTVGSPDVSGVTDTLTNTWGQDYMVTVGSFKFEVWSAPSPSAGANTVSVAFAAGTPSSRMWVVELETPGTVTLDTTSNADDSTANARIDGATLTTAGAALLFTVFRLDTGGAVTITNFDDTAGKAWAYLRGNDGNQAAAWRIVDAATSVAPVYVGGTSTTGESITVSYGLS